MPLSYKPFHSYLITPMRGNIRSFLTRFMSPDVYVWPEPVDEEPSSFYLASPHLDDASSPQELVDRTASLMAVFEGAMLLVFGMQSERLRLRSLLDGATLPSNFLTGMEKPGNVLVEPFSEGAVKRRCGDVEDPFSHPIAMLVFLARYDPVTLDLLKYLGFNGISYVSLYALLDWMTHEAPKSVDRKRKDFVPGLLQWDLDRVADEAGWSKSKLNRFTGTANNPTYLGPFSRHGGKDDPPRKPMAIEVAEGPLRLATRRYLAARAFSIDLRSKWLALV